MRSGDLGGREVTPHVHFGDLRLPDRFWSKIAVQPDGCWNWLRDRSQRGYGRFYVKGLGRWRAVYAHRLSYGTLVAPIPERLVIDHLCRNRSCCNPAHLEPVTQAENNLRGRGGGWHNRNKTHCKHGHAFTPENTFRTSDNRRGCRTCKNAGVTARRYADPEYGKKRGARRAA